MTESVTPDGEVIEDSRSPLQIAKSELAAFKFKLIETVAADPKLKAAPCTEAIVIYAGFVTIDKRTLRPTDAFCSTIKLMARGKMKSKTTARLARKLLQENGYLIPSGSATKDGCVRYHLANPRAHEVAMHVKEAEEYLGQTEAHRKEEERRKRRGASVLYPQKQEGGSIFDRTGDQCTDPNYLREYLGVSLSEEGSHPIKVSSVPLSYADREDDPHQPFPIPTSEEEAIFMLDELRRGAGLSAGVLAYFRKKLWAGELTPHMIEEQRRLAAA